MDAEGTEMCYSKTVNEKIKGFENQWNHILRLVERPHMQEALRSKYAKELDRIRAAAEKRKRELIHRFDAGY